MTVIIFSGPPRTGKTYLMTWIANDFHRKEQHRVYANYQLNFPFERVNLFDMLDIPFAVMDRDKKTLCIQEADKIFDSRSSSRQENKLLSSLTGQSGKRNLNILYDTQFENRIDNGLRYVTEHVIYSQPPFLHPITKQPILFNYIYVDVYGHTEKPFSIPALQEKYDLYDSYEATEPFIIAKEE